MYTFTTSAMGYILRLPPYDGEVQCIKKQGYFVKFITMMSKVQYLYMFSTVLFSIDCCKTIRIKAVPIAIWSQLVTATILELGRIQMKTWILFCALVIYFMVGIRNGVSWMSTTGAEGCIESLPNTASCPVYWRRVARRVWFVYRDACCNRPYSLPRQGLFSC